VLAYSASSDRAFVLGMIGAGADGYLVKTGQLQELLDALDTLSRGDLYLSETIRAQVFDHVRSSMRHDPARAVPLTRDQQVVDEALRPGGLQIATQPIVDLTTLRVVGSEALARFRHVEGPGPVFAAAARLGRSADVELAAARHAIETAAAVPGEFLSINASPDVVVDEGFESVVLTVDPASIVIELTEQAQVRDYPRLRRSLDRLRGRGIRLAIDDVGSGFACLTHVHRLSPDIIKVDRYLVEDVHEDRARRSMVVGLVGIAADIGATVIAEGIEQTAELGCLQDLGVDLGQGFLLGVPAIDLQSPRTEAAAPPDPR
jgi:EAL domain-containing protein (putative c-di-GMP-specific phosphodiesterase class I)